MVSDATEPAAETAEEESVTSHDSGWSWMFRGLMVGAILIGSANAISFFFRSRGWGSLLGNRDFGDEAIGFPMTIWQEGIGYSSHALKGGPFMVNVAAAIVLGLGIGLLALSQRDTLNQIMERFRAQNQKHDVRLQFSLRGLLITTVLAALAAGAARAFTPRVEVLAAIYALGPLGLIVLAYLPRRLSWQQRVAILTPCTFILIAVAIALGGVLSVDFDKVLMGIFICWTPQAAIGAVVITAWMLFQEYQTLGET